MIETMTQNIERFGSNPKLKDGRVMPLSLAVAAGNFVFVSGQVPFNENGELVSGFEEQVIQVIRNIENALKQTELSLENVVKCNVWLSDPDDFGRFNEIYAEYFGNNPPARTTVGSVLLVDAAIEMDAIAYRP
jgi:2-iminobutanoate/2-iminopropanoate deaminase